MMISLLSFVLITSFLSCNSLSPKNLPRQGTGQGKRLDFDLNLPPPEENTNERNPILESHVITHHTGIKDPIHPSPQTDDCTHNPSCGHWKSIPQKDRNKLYCRWHRLNRTEEQKIADKKASSIRSKKRYRGFTEEEKKIHNDKSVQVQKRRLEKMTPDEKRKWHRKKNSRRSKPGLLQELQDE